MYKVTCGGRAEHQISDYRYPIMVKCLNMGKAIRRSMSNYKHYHSGDRSQVSQKCSMKAIVLIFILHQLELLSSVGHKTRYFVNGTVAGSH